MSRAEQPTLYCFRHPWLTIIYLIIGFTLLHIWNHRNDEIISHQRSYENQQEIQRYKDAREADCQAYDAQVRELSRRNNPYSRR
jgi:hypothetical protein